MAAKNSYDAYPDGQQVTFTDESLTQQQFKDECDLNKVMEVYVNTGLWMGDSLRESRDAVFADVVGFEDYQDVMDNMEAVNAAFEELPADVRLLFNNQPGELVTWLANPANVEEAKSLLIVSDEWTV